MQKTMVHVLHDIAEAMVDAGDHEQAGKIKELIAKSNTSQLEIACCGHFSAGKSTLINTLCGENLLPSSPIPTSANIVTLRFGSNSKAIIHQHDGTERVADVQNLAEACKNGGEIEEVTIEYPWTQLSKQIVLLDTPGIDSTDEAHHLATVSAMHRAEAVFYVMDYNHVQSEINFSFLKQLAERQKPIYMIVNQIDKHREQELSFPDFRQAVEQAFADWGLQPAGLFFISLKQPNHPYNEWEALLDFMNGLSQHANVLIPYNLFHASISVIQEHGKWRQQRYTDQRDQLEAELRKMDIEQLLSERQQLQEQLETLHRKPNEWMQETKQELERLIDNANVMPATTRELARAVLESMQPSFKTGWFRNKNKIESERTTRLNAFLTDVREQTQVQLHTHIVRWFEEKIDSLGLERSEWMQQLDRWENAVSEQDILATIPPGAGATGEAVLNYTQRLSAHIKQHFRKLALAMLHELMNKYEQKLAPEITLVSEKLDQLSKQLSAYEQLQQMDQEQNEYVQQLLNCLHQTMELQDVQIPTHHVKRNDVVQVNASELDSKQEKEEGFGVFARSSRHQNEGQMEYTSDDHWRRRMEEDLEKTAQQLISAAQELQEFPALRSTVDSLIEKAERMKQHRVSLALFGAFSAGKSSLANALLGSSVLPVSPNPTTAAINRIAPPSSSWEHGSAKVTLKTEERLFEELLYSLDRLGLHATNVEEALTQIKRIDVKSLTPKGRPHFSFLRAVSEGWNHERDKLGTSFKVHADLYREYAAIESRSCFVEEIELYVDSPMTDAGVSLVDTPGADSINARHTGVAFNYIKNADAILFVTYYNHAFSQADKQFLDQLGRVKDNFELDKMFFLVNAADLADSEQELNGVLDHVRERLQEHGIRNPRIYPISSVLALEGKQTGNRELIEKSGMAHFEREFFSFLFKEWNELVSHAANQEIERAATSMARWIEQAEAGEQKQLEELSKLKQAYVTFKQELEASDAEYDVQAIGTEAEELIYYVRQRVQHRFREFFTLAFNPSSLSTVQGDVQQALMEAWKELIRILSYELSQEMLATTLRLEQKLKHLLENERQRWLRLLQENFNDFALPPFPNLQADVPSVAEELKTTSPSAKWFAQQFKNAKQFFEGDRSRQMQEQLEERLQPDILQYTQEHASRFISFYVEVHKNWQSIIHQQLIQATDEYVQGFETAFSQKINVDELKEKLIFLQHLLAQMNESEQGKSHKFF